ncbi:transcriptional regulator domain-containing protein [Mesorhizobium australicum]|uniref:transcriptional regulator domain-containing protein n=1 Tax=Mesorhizobium australicum TaxID=536018 RepID=UPI003EBB5A04
MRHTESPRPWFAESAQRFADSPTTRIAYRQGCSFRNPQPDAGTGRGLGTLRGDWTDPAAYAHMQGYEPAEFAAEYLIRNDDFVAECGQLSSHLPGSVEPIGPPDFITRWGARFHSHG